ncbi:hypothetical protein [Rickettsia felis]|uniref:hypothetical protein n=1 Tax=Rickettsia felis TaxID=42862 RepID=UPI001584BF85|nr:hypothetical protein [Rickettsia felis]
MRVTLGVVGYQIVIARSEATWQSRKIIKKVLTLVFFYWIASSNYYVIFLAMTIW